MSEHTITKRSDIPNAPYYVTCTDPFMSGWGEADGMINKVILPCADYNEAAFVAAMAHRRGDMKRISITSRKPTMKRNVLYSCYTRPEGSSWFTLSFGVYHKNNPADGLRIECNELNELRRGPYNVNISNADFVFHGSANRAPITDLGRVLTICAEVAHVAGCRSIEIEAY
jgi:hypothetical protein